MCWNSCSGSDFSSAEKTKLGYNSMLAFLEVGSMKTKGITSEQSSTGLGSKSCVSAERLSNAVVFM